MKMAIFSFFGRLVRKEWLVMPGKRKRDVLERGQTGSKIREYYYIKYTMSALRVIAWIVLILGFIGSLIWGITTGEMEGGLRIVLGMIGSFLAWLALLAARELLQLFVDVKENTRNTAGSVTKILH